MSPIVPPDASNVGFKLLTFTGIFYPILVACVALRYLARYLNKGSWGLDDILVFSSLILETALAAISISAVKSAGVGRHVQYLEAFDPEAITRWSKHLVAVEYVYLIGVNVPKLAILALYRRLFPMKSIRIVIYCLMAFLVSLTISSVVTASVACIPFAANWDLTIEGHHCINKEAFFIWVSLPNLISDLVLLVLPMPVVWKLHTSTRMKVGLTVTFAVGSFGLVTSIIRLVNFFGKNSFIDGTWSAVDLLIVCLPCLCCITYNVRTFANLVTKLKWTQVESGVYLISACLPTYRTFLDRLGKKKFFSRMSTRKQQGQYLYMAKSQTRRTESHIPLGPMIDKPNEVTIKGHGFYRLEDGRSEDASSQGVYVTTEIDVDTFKTGVGDLP